MKIVAVTVCLLLTVSAKVYDLTHLFNEKAHRWPVYETNVSITVKLNLTLEEDGVYWGYGVGNDMTYAEHTGTHIDAPIHFSLANPEERAKQWWLHEIPIERLVGKLHVIDVKSKVAADPEYIVTPEDILEHEDKYGKIENGSIVLCDFDWAKKWDSAEEHFGTTTENLMKSDTFKFPGLGLEGAILLEQRGIYGYGSQCASADASSTHVFGVHKYLQSNNIWLLENVGELGELPPGGQGLTAIVGVMKTEWGTGGPVRLIAVPSEDDKSASSDVHSSMLTLLISVITLAVMTY